MLNTYLENLSQRKKTQIEIVGNVFKLLLLQIALFQMRADNTIIMWSIFGALLAFIIGSFIINHYYLPSIDDAELKEEIIELGGKYQLLKRRSILYSINLVCVAILLYTLPNFYLQQFFIVCFFGANIAIYLNGFNSNYQFRVLYGLEIYMLFITISTLYSVIYYQYFPIPFYVLPIIVLLISYFAFDYLLMKRKHRIYTVLCVTCKFRRSRKKYLITYSIIITLFFSALVYTKVSILMSSIILTMLLHIMRGFTCLNFKNSVSKETKQSYIYILIILLLIAASTITTDTGKVNPTDGGNQVIRTSNFNIQK